MGASLNLYSYKQLDIQTFLPLHIIFVSTLSVSLVDDSLWEVAYNCELHLDALFEFVRYFTFTYDSCVVSI